jgi:DNA-damage-inducible protein D
LFEMNVTKRSTHGGFGNLLGSEVRRVLTADGRTVYAVVDLVEQLAGTRQPAEYWADLKLREPVLASLCRQVSYAASEDAEPVTLDAVDVEGVLRLVQSIPTARAERVRRWLAQTARERLEEEKNPELAVMRTRRLYESKGYSRRWVDKRLRGVSARHELTGEWFKRGATESDQYRALTNAIMKGAFGMEVEQYRQHKSLFKTGETLRDHMSDLELALTALGETVAVALHRDHDSRGYEQLEADATAAGEIVAKTREEIELRTGRPVVQSGNYRDWWARGGTRRRPSAPAAPAARAVSGPVTRSGGDASEGAKDTSPEATALSEADRKAVA